MFNISIPIEISILFIFVFGLFLGHLAHFLVCIFEGKRKIHPYKCSSCLQAGDFIPILSWLWSKGKCRKCGRKQDIRRYFIELLMSGSFIGIFLFVSSYWFSLEIAIFCFMSIIACAVDIKRTILPDTFTLGGIAIALFGAFLNPDREFLQALTGAVLSGGILILFSYCFYFLRKVEGIGGGDIKMIAWIGALVGLNGVFYVILISCVLGMLWGLCIFVRKYKNKWIEQEIAFGPYLAFSTYIFIILSEGHIISKY